MKNIERVKNKIRNLSQLQNDVKTWREENSMIVFTNGCFDILHKGHVDYLNKAADFGDKLIIGVNSDSSVRELKGSNRPIQDEVSRCWLLASLECVSAVVVFSDQTPLKLIEVIKPDVLVKGGDYQLENIVGAQEVIENGGEVKIVEFLEGYSTSSIETKILRSDTH
mgnify:CR=1 FL=1